MLKKLNLKMVLSCVAAILGLVAFFLMFAPAATTEMYGHEIWYSGFALAFGCIGDDFQHFGASVNICTYILLLAGIGCAVVSFFGEGGKALNIISASAFLIAGVLYFFVIPLSKPSAHWFLSSYSIVFSIGIGSIFGGILSILAAVAVAVPLFIKRA